MNNSTVLLIARILLGVLFILAGLNKFGGIDGTAGYIASKGLPLPIIVAWLTAIFEVVAGVMILVGFKTQLTSYALAAFCILSAIIFHNGLADPSEMTAMLKNFALAGGFLALSAAGAGSISVDAKRG